MMRGNGVIGGSGRLYGMPSTARNAPPWSTEVGFGAIHGPPPPPHLSTAGDPLGSRLAIACRLVPGKNESP